MYKRYIRPTGTQKKDHKFKKNTNNKMMSVKKDAGKRR